MGRLARPAGQGATPASHFAATQPAKATMATTKKNWEAAKLLHTSGRTRAVARPSPFGLPRAR
jgi:hypothetical protein